MKIEHKIIIKNIPDEFIRCRECDRPFKKITISHLNSRHGTTMELYRKKHPDAPLVCAEVLLKSSKTMKKKFESDPKCFEYLQEAITPEKRKEILKKALSKESIKKNVDTMRLIREKIPEVQENYHKAMEKVYADRTYDDVYLIEQYNMVKNKLGHVPSTLEIKEHTGISVGPYTRRWGSFNDFVLKQGDIPKKMYQITKKEYIEDIKRVWNELGHQPTIKEYDSHGRFHSSTSHNKLHMPWADLLISLGGVNLGFLVGGYNKISREKLEKEYVKVRKMINSPLTQDDMINTGKYCCAPYAREWGAFSQARNYLERKYFNKQYNEEEFMKKLMSERISYSHSKKNKILLQKAIELHNDGFNQYEIGGKIGVSQATISNWLKNLRSMMKMHSN